MKPIGSVGWAERWPVFEDLPHFIIVVQHLPANNVCRCLGITHSADLFDRGGSVRITNDLCRSVYPPLSSASVIGVVSDGLPVWVDCVFDGDVITNHRPSIKTKDWKQMAGKEWNSVLNLIRLSARSCLKQ